MHRIISFLVFFSGCLLLIVSCWIKSSLPKSPDGIDPKIAKGLCDFIVCNDSFLFPVISILLISVSLLLWGCCSDKANEVPERFL